MTINDGDNVFIDTNVLIFYLHPSYINHWKHPIYVNTISMLQEKKCQMFINSLVVSEFINRFLRYDFNKMRDEKPDIKEFKRDYRQTQYYKDTLQFAITELSKFCEIFNVRHISDDFDKMNIIALYAKYKYSFDFNDLIIAENVRSNNLKLLTDDKDFQNLDVALIKAKHLK